jgi:TonB family protein
VIALRTIAIVAASLALPISAFCQTSNYEFTWFPAPYAPTPENIQAAQAMLAYYPAAAQAAGVEGTATLRCSRTIHNGLKDCTLLSENPLGASFGQAALTIARASPENPDINLTPSQASDSERIVFAFTLHPTAITPDVLAIPHLVERPRLLKAPTDHQLTLAASDHALARKINGSAVMSCLLTQQGALDDCRILRESPPDAGYGQTALKVARFFKFSPELRDGEPVGGGIITLPLGFAVNEVPAY